MLGRAVRTLGLGLVVVVGCASISPPSRTAADPSPAAGVAPPAATAEPVASAQASPPPDANITFVENDYARALAYARARKVPLFVDAWAPWCHTCLSMRSYVFPDTALRPFASRFVWLAIDTERDENAPLVAHLAVKSLPTLYVIDSATEQPVLAWPGSLTATELVALLDDAEAAAKHGDAGGEASAALLRGHKATAAGKLDEAIADYRAALAAAPSGWPRRAQTVDALVTGLSNDRQLAGCLVTAADEAPKMPPGTALTDVLRQAIGCADSLPKDAAENARLGDVVTVGERVAADLSQPILADDRSDLYDYLLSALRKLGRADEAERLAKAWAAFLEDQAAHALTPAARAVFDAHRVLAYVALHQPERAVPMLQQSERDFPQDYNPPARLGTAYLAMKRYDDALVAVQRALGRAYGPRKLRLWSLEADVYEARGDRRGARTALEEAVAFAKTLPLSASYPQLREALEKRLAKMH